MLSGGAAHMVYSEFVITTRAAFGEYQPCNPCNGQKPAGGGGHSDHSDHQYCAPGVKNGTFTCQSYGGGGGPPPPPQCLAGFQIWSEDCLNGTVYKKLPVKKGKGEGACCAACTADKAKCAGWNMPGGVNGTECQLMKEPLVMWHGGQSQSKCKAAQVDHSEYNCWYNNPQYNVSFAPYCDKKECQCAAIENSVPMGRELDPMCHEGATRKTTTQKKQSRRDAQAAALTKAAARRQSKNGVRFSRVDGRPLWATPNYWTCSDMLEKLCFDQYHPRPDCASCAVTAANKKTLSAAGCTPQYLGHLCNAYSFDTCREDVEKLCKGSVGKSNACNACVQKHTTQLEHDNCTSTFVEYACQGGHGGGGDNKWEQYMRDLACHLNGTWYSSGTGEAGGKGMCKGNKLEKDCWWHAEHVRTVNQTCVDDNVVAAVQAVRPKCWNDCPNNQGTNITSACYLECLFDTMIGNSTAKPPVKPMTPAHITAAFLKSFHSDKPSEGGCLTVKQPKPTPPSPKPPPPPPPPGLKGWACVSDKCVKQKGGGSKSDCQQTCP